jgi:NADPH-dependent glutamate synthase beta subunit-like oxidoreductase
LSCAYYLALTGRTVDVYDIEAQPGGLLRQMAADGALPPEALRRDLQGVLAHNIHFNGRQKPGETFDIAELRHAHGALYVTAELVAVVDDALVALCGANWRDALDPATRQMTSQPGVYVGAAHSTVVKAVAEGRRLAVSINQSE